MTATAYVASQALRAGGDQAFDLAVSRIPPDLRQRAPSRSKPELLAVQLTAKPQTMEERKSCSAYASLLVVAQARGITSEGYREWASGVDLADAEVQAKKIRAALKASAPDEFEGDRAPIKPIYRLQVAVLVDKKQRGTMLLEIEADQANEFSDAIKQAGATGDYSKLADAITELSKDKDT